MKCTFSLFWTPDLILRHNLKKQRIMDKDLTFLRYADPEDLRILTDYITMNRKGNPRFNERLTTTPEYARYYPDGLNNMVDSIVEEFQYYGGNTVLNFMRGRGAGYREILCDVCHRMRVNFNRKSSVEVIEMNLLHSILIKSLEDMDTESLKELLDSLNIKTTKFDKQAMVAAVQIAIRKGGFAAYKIAVIVANAIARALLGRGLSLAANAALVRWLSVFAGPIGWAITAAWTAFDIAGPAYRVTIPAVIQIAYMRAKRDVKGLLTDDSEKGDNDKTCYE